MAVGDTISGTITVPSTSSLTIRPSLGVGYIITNIYYGGTSNYDLDLTDATTDINLYTAETGHIENKKYMITNGNYLKITNNHFNDHKFMYTGVEI